MKKYIYNFLSVIVLFTGFSCADQLNVEPQNSIKAGEAIRTSADVEALIISAYDQLGDGDFLGGNILRDSELLGDDGEIVWDGTFVAPGEIWEKNILINNGQVESTWSAGYQVINVCNNALANLDLVVNAKKDSVEGQAKFVRAVAYFELVKMYARTWVDGDPTVNPGVPLVTEPTTLDNISEPKNRATVAAVYAQIISDLTDAEDLLIEDNGFLANTYTASAILSRVYLMQNNYAGARDAADRVINSEQYVLTGSFYDAFNKGSVKGANATTEDVFAIQVTTQDGINNMNTFFDAFIRADVFIDDPHFDIYESGDDRSFFFYFSNYTAKFNNPFGNIPYMRLAEMYLTRAEANFRLTTAVGDTPENDLNVIRNRAGLADLGVAITLDEILLERRRELAFEGQKLHDYKRTMRSVGAFDFDAPQLIYPIPARERIINPALTQNFGY